MNQPEAGNHEFEQSLTQVMRPVDAPEGFADRVMARARPSPAKIIPMPPRLRAWAMGAVAAALLAATFLGEQAYLRQERRKAELAQQQFEAGMRITDQTLDHVRRQLQQAGVSLGN